LIRTFERPSEINRQN